MSAGRTYSTKAVVRAALVASAFLIAAILLFIHGTHQHGSHTYSCLQRSGTRGTCTSSGTRTKIFAGFLALIALAGYAMASIGPVSDWRRRRTSTDV